MKLTDDEDLIENGSGTYPTTDISVTFTEITSTDVIKTRNINEAIITEQSIDFDESFRKESSTDSALEVFSPFLIGLLGVSFRNQSRKS